MLGRPGKCSGQFLGTVADASAVRCLIERTAVPWSPAAEGERVSHRASGSLPVQRPWNWPAVAAGAVVGLSDGSGDAVGTGMEVGVRAFGVGSEQATRFARSTRMVVVAGMRVLSAGGFLCVGGLHPPFYASPTSFLSVHLSAVWVSLVLQRQFLNMVDFEAEIASRSARPQSCQACGIITVKKYSRSISCEASL